METGRIAPGLLLCAAIACAAAVIHAAQSVLFGRPIIEALVVAILLGMVVRARSPGIVEGRSAPGIRWSGGPLLEIAVAMLGASVDGTLLFRAGLPILVAVLVVVTAGLGLTYAVARALSLDRRLAVLIACGNAICGNSAIAAVAPIIGADSKDVATSIAFTAVIGVAVVILLPLTITLFHLSSFQYGVLAGLTVYAVPQVLAATLPVSAISAQIGTFVKLVRVLMLGPLVVALSLRTRGRAALERGSLHRLVPWFIVAFLLLAALRTAGVISPALAEWLHAPPGILATVAMAALGLGVDARSLARAGPRVIAAVSVSLTVLIALSVVLIMLLRIGS